MELLQIAVRIAFAYTFALILTRISGHQTVKQLDVASFVIAIVIGDLFDDLIWSEVPAANFVVALATLFVVHVWVGGRRRRAGERDWVRMGGA